MTSKLIINIKKLISVLLFTSLISSILPSNLLNNTVFATSPTDFTENDRCNVVTSFKSMKDAIKESHNNDNILLNNDITVPNNDDYLLIDKDITITSLPNKKYRIIANPKSKFLNICNNCAVNLENITVHLFRNDDVNQYNNKQINLNYGSKLNINKEAAIIISHTANKSDEVDNYDTDIPPLWGGSNEPYIFDYDGNPITYSGPAHFHTVSRILNETDNNTPLEEGTDYTVSYFTNEDNSDTTMNITFKKEYLEKLPKGQAYDIRVYYYILGDPEYGEDKKKDPIRIGTPILNQPNDATWSGSNEPYIFDYDGNPITYSGPAHFHTVSRILNETDNNTPLEEGTDYTVSYFTNEDNSDTTMNITFKKEYLEKLPKGQAYDIRVYYYILGDPECGEDKKKDPIRIGIPKLNQPNDATFDNLKQSYTYGEDPSTIYFTGGAGDGNVNYYSSDSSVATIENTDKNTGKLNIVKPGKFIITVIKESDKNYTDLVLPSKEISVLPKELTLKNIKIKDKVYDGKDLAEFEGDPKLDGLLPEDKDKVFLKGSPKFSSTGPGNDIDIDFEGVSLDGDSSSNYELIKPKNIKANILPKPPQVSNIFTEPFNKNDVKLTFINPLDLIKNNKLKTTNPTSNVQQDLNYNSDNSDDSTQSDSDETTTDDDDPDEIFEAEDSKTGIQVYAPKGVFPKWSRLVVREMYPNTNEYDNAYKNLDENIKRKIEHIRLYEVYVVNQYGEVIQPNISKGLVTVRIPIPNDYDLADLQIYRIKQDADDNFDTNIVNINNKNYCEFQTNHFSTYTIIDERTTNDIILSILPYLILLLILILISLFILILTKRNKDEDKFNEEQQ